MSESQWKRISKDDVVSVDQCVGTADYQFTASNNPEKTVGYIRFQTGNPADGINGITIESLLEVIASRLDAFQQTEFNCAENAEALEKVLWARDTLYSRTQRAKEDGAQVENDETAVSAFGERLSERELSTKHQQPPMPRLVPVYVKDGVNEDAFVSPDVWPPYVFTYGENDPLHRIDHESNFLKVGHDIPDLLELCYLGHREPSKTDEIDDLSLYAILVEVNGEVYSSNVYVPTEHRPVSELNSSEETKTVSFSGAIPPQALLTSKGETFANLHPDLSSPILNVKVTYNRVTRALSSLNVESKDKTEAKVVGFILGMGLSNVNIE